MPFTILDPTAAAAAPVTTQGSPLTSQGYTLDAFHKELQLLLQDRDDVDTPQLTSWINQSYTDVCTSIDLDELKGSIAITLVAGQALYRLPYVVSHVLGAAIVLPTTVNVNGGYPLDKGDLSSYRALMEESGDPEFFFRHGDMLVFWPTPDAARTVAVDFRLRPVWMTDLTHSPLLGLEWHEVILLGARYRGFSANLEWDKAVPAEQEYLRLLRRRTNREATEHEGRVVLSSVPRRLEDVRRRVVRRSSLEPE